MRFVLEVVPLTEPTQRMSYTDKRKAIKAFLEGVRSVKRKKLWGVRLLLIYGTGSYDYWIMADAYQEPMMGRGLNDLPPTELLVSFLRTPRRKQTARPNHKGRGKGTKNKTTTKVHVRKATKKVRTR